MLQDGQTPLHRAIALGHLSVMQELLPKMDPKDIPLSDKVIDRDANANANRIWCRPVASARLTDSSVG